MTKKKNSLVDLLARAKSARAAMGEKKWAIYVKEQQEIAAQSLIQTKREFDKFINSPEHAARDALELGLNELKTNAVIQKSETCIEALDALIWCVKYGWWAKDSEALLRPIGYEYQRIKAREGAKASLAKSPKQEAKKIVRACWDKWQLNPKLFPGKAAFARDIIEKELEVKSTRVIERWCKEWESVPG